LALVAVFCAAIVRGMPASLRHGSLPERLSVRHRRPPIGRNTLPTAAFNDHTNRRRRPIVTDDKSKDIVANPSKEFTDPSEVVTTPDLSAKQKAAALEEWELDARLMQVATEEGMTGTEPNKLIEVKKAQNDLGIDTLKKKDDSSGPNKTGM
jgi:hypothetical protein